MWTEKLVFSPETILSSKAGNNLNDFKQTSSWLFGNPQDISDLSQLDSASILVISDSHGAYYNLRMIVQQFGAACNAMIFCGDGICDIARLAEESFSDEELAKCIPPVIGVVEGNGDTDVYPFPVREGGTIPARIPVNCTMEAAGHKIFFTHGHRYPIYSGNEELREAAGDLDCSAVFYGHTHIARGALEPGNIFFLNPGSCSRPRGGQPQSFALVTVAKDKNYFSPVFHQITAGKCIPYIPEDVF